LADLLRGKLGELASRVNAFHDPRIITAHKGPKEKGRARRRGKSDREEVMSGIAEDSWQPLTNATVPDKG
jgi:hypothetical protein